MAPSRNLNPNDLRMKESELAWWERTRERGAFFYIVTKGLLFLIAYPLLGRYAIGWDYSPELLVEGWVGGIICGGFVFMRKELRYRFTLDLEGRLLPEARDD